MSLDFPENADDDRWYTAGADRHYDGRADGTAIYRIAGPATALIVVSLLTLIVSLIGSGICVMVAVQAENFADRNMPADDLRVIMSIYAAIAAVMAAYGGVMLFGAVRMKQVRSYGWAMAAAIMAVASFACIGLCSVFILPFGIWALVVLGDSAVKRQFQGSNFQTADYDDQL